MNINVNVPLPLLLLFFILSGCATTAERKISFDQPQVGISTQPNGCYLIEVTGRSLHDEADSLAKMRFNEELEKITRGKSHEIFRYRETTYEEDSSIYFSGRTYSAIVWTEESKISLEEAKSLYVLQ